MGHHSHMNVAAFSIDDLIRHELPAARSGDRNAYGRIVAACQNTVTAVALAITRDVATSEDIAQEAFLNAWQHLERLNSPDSFLPWLRQITRNLARDHLRAHRNQPLDGPNAELVMAMAADPGAQPMQKMLEDERESTAFELISSLPDDSREALLLFYREGQSSQQVAMLLGISDAAARKRLSRARQLVRDDMLKRFGDFARSSAPSTVFTAAIVTALGVASKPAAAAGATVIGTATLGGALAGKGLAGVVGMGGLIGGSLVGGAVAAHLTRKYLLVFADTLDERDAILRSYRLYLYVTLSVMLAAFLVAWWVPSLAWTMAATIAAECASLWTLLRIRNVLLPMMARDASRDPKGAKGRYWAYNFSYGPLAIVVSGVVYVPSMAIFYLGVQHSDQLTAAAVTIMRAAFRMDAGL